MSRARQFATYAKPFIEPDMSQYYFLLRQQRLRAELEHSYPDLARRTEALFQSPAVKSFLQAVPSQNIPAHDPEPGTVQPGVIPRGIAITNSITGRKILIRNLFEQALAPAQNAEDIARIEAEIHDCVDHFGVAAELGKQAITATKREAQHLRMRAFLKSIDPLPALR